jgi:hypothetical protein
MRDLPERMNAAVGASGTPNLYLSLKKSFRSLGEFALNSASVGLFLPAAITRAFVLNQQFPVLHSPDETAIFKL